MSGDIKKEIAKGLLDIEAVFLRPEEPFTWASGIKSPVYCDNRLILTAPDIRNTVENAIAETIKKYYADAQVLMGTSTAEDTYWVFLWDMYVLAPKITEEATG